VRAWITRDVIAPVEVLNAIGAHADGAALLFLGTVRDEHEGRAVRGMRYEAYAEMAEDTLRQIVAEAGAQAGSDRIAAVHRIGELDLGEVSVAVAVSAPHRAEAFTACRYIIEQIKQRLPVWKHEHYADGESNWLPGLTPPVEP
jgi:molybdopterin synthase catalytic subunit